MDQEEWNKQKRYLEIGCVISLMMLLVSIFSGSTEVSGLRTKNFVLESIDLKDTKGPYSSAVVYFAGSYSPFYIHHEEKKFLDRKLVSQLHKGTILSVTYSYDDIFEINYQNKGLFDKTRVDNYKFESRKPGIGMSVTALILCFIPWCFKKQPRFQVVRKSIGFEVDFVWIGILVIVLTIVRFAIIYTNPVLEKYYP